jgi:translation initiation factor 3 subunit H
MQKNLQYLLDCADVQQQELNNYQYWQRSVAREQVKIQGWLTKRVSCNYDWIEEKNSCLCGRDKKTKFVPRRDKILYLRMKSTHCSRFLLSLAV